MKLRNSDMLSSCLYSRAWLSYHESCKLWNNIDCVQSCDHDFVHTWKRYKDLICLEASTKTLQCLAFLSLHHAIIDAKNRTCSHAVHCRILARLTLHQSTVVEDPCVVQDDSWLLPKYLFHFVWFVYPEIEIPEDCKRLWVAGWSRSIQIIFPSVQSQVRHRVSRER